MPKDSLLASAKTSAELGPAGQYAGTQAFIYLPEESKWLCFRNPLEILVAHNPEDVVSVLDHVEKEVESKKIYAVGFMAYETGVAFDPALRFNSGGDFPLVWFGLFSKAEPFTPPPVRSRAPWSPKWHSSVTKDEYTKAIQLIKSYLAGGETYQVNYSYRLRASFQGDALAYFLQIAGRGNLPYAAFIESDRYAICSFSPELFFSLDGKTISSKPMKGTMPRGLLYEDDLARAEELHSSEKNRAENIMIVDMMRNDFGKIAVPGTVDVPTAFDIEKYDTVWQMTSTVQAQTTASLFQIFQALFPPASCTGAPKVRTTQIITELETSPRRIYTGSIGFLAPGRKMQFNVAIRTILVDKHLNEAEYGVGGGIVWDSSDTDEYDECAVKAKVVCERRVDFDLLETMLWTNSGSYLLLDSHIARLKASAEYFSFKFNENNLKAELASFASKLTPRSQRVRLLLNREGHVKLKAEPYQPEISKKMSVCPAKYHVASDSVYLYHKTTNRRVYDNAKALGPEYDEVILWNEKGEVTEFCTGNIIVKIKDEFLTPPLKCGLLPGTFRAWLLKKGIVKERIIKLEMLRQCEKIYFCNSVRKMMEVRVDLIDCKVNGL
ncbi:aminodeoxychorismate synthase component I [Verrucomicrobiota bacterium]